jgi:hypothetical protein
LIGMAGVRQYAPTGPMAEHDSPLPFDNCLDCPHHKELSDPGSDDPFDRDDTSIVCTQTPPIPGARLPYRAISVSERPHRHRGYCDVPAWCPLLEPAAR